MARPFSLTMRSMETDHPKTVMAVLSIAILVVCAWNIWFFCAKISVYEMSINAMVDEHPEKIIPSFSGPGRIVETRQNHIIASFPIRMKNRIARGQRGLFFPIMKQGEFSEGVNCVIVEIEIKKDKESIQAILKTKQSKYFPVHLQPETSGLIKLEVDRLTPFSLLLQRIESS